MRHSSQIDFIKSTTIAAAVAFDPGAQDLLANAAALAEQLDKELCILHVVEPWCANTRIELFGHEDLFWKGMLAVERNSVAQAEEKLQAIVASIPKRVPTRTIVNSGKVVPSLCAEAKRARASLLLISGESHKGTQALPHLAVASSVAAAAETPVMVLPRVKNAFPQREPRVLIADDLSDGTDQALELGIALAAAMPDALISHVHITSVTEEVLDAGLTAAAVTTRTPAVDLPVAEIYAGYEIQLLAKLEERFNYARTAVGVGEARYQPSVRIGAPMEQLSLAIAEYAPNMLVFGRHRMVHSHPFGLGRMPFKAMMRFGLPVIIVPQG